MVLRQYSICRAIQHIRTKTEAGVRGRAERLGFGEIERDALPKSLTRHLMLPKLIRLHGRPNSSQPRQKPVTGQSKVPAVRRMSEEIVVSELIELKVAEGLCCSPRTLLECFEKADPALRSVEVPTFDYVAGCRRLSGHKERLKEPLIRNAGAKPVGVDGERLPERSAPLGDLLTPAIRGQRTTVAQRRRLSPATLTTSKSALNEGICASHSSSVGIGPPRRHASA